MYVLYPSVSGQIQGHKRSVAHYFHIVCCDRYPDQFVLLIEPKKAIATFRLEIFWVFHHEVESFVLRIFTVDFDLLHTLITDLHNQCLLLMRDKNGQAKR